MAERRLFRFRLPWLNMQAPSRTVENETPRPVAETQTNTTVSIQRPPFRPAGIAPVQPPPARSESGPPVSPQRAAKGASKVSEPPPSPSVTPPRIESQPPESPPPSTGDASKVSSSPANIVSQPQSPSKSSLNPPPPLTPPLRNESQPPVSPPLTTGDTFKVSSSPASIASQPQSPSKSSLNPPPPSPLTPPPRNESQPPVSPPLATGAGSKASSSPTSIASPQPPPFSASTTTKQEKEEEPTQPQSVVEETQSKPKIKSDFQNQPQVEATNETIQSDFVKEAAFQSSPVLTNNLAKTQELSKNLQEKTAENDFNFSVNHKKTSNSEIHKQTNLGKHENSEKTRDTKNTSMASNAGDSTLSHEKIDKPAFHKEIWGDLTKFVHKVGTAPINYTENDKPISVITLAGENRGASMQMGIESTNKERSVHIHRGYKTNPNESLDTTTDADEIEKKMNKLKNKEDQAPNAYINNNIQSINNSIVFNSNLSERNPGVHLDSSQNQTRTVGSNGKMGSVGTQKDEFNTTSAEKHTYQPRIKRRCLRGLMMESSDSDPDNPDKPRRHGCRYVCMDKGKDHDKETL